MTAKQVSARKTTFLEPKLAKKKQGAPFDQMKILERRTEPKKLK